MQQNLLSLAASRMVYLGRSQSLLAQNIANIDTPGFSPKAAVPFAETLRGTGEVALAVTDPRDIQPLATSGADATVATVAARAPDGNAVSLDDELAGVARTQIGQQYAVNIYKSYLGMFTTALGPNP